MRSLLANGTAARAGVRQRMALRTLNGTDAEGLGAREVQDRVMEASPKAPLKLEFAL